jgi:hypothetical protein
VHYISFESVWGSAKLTPAINNKWSLSWMKVRFYCKVLIAVGGKSVHVLHSYMSNLEYLTEPPHNCPVDDSNDKAFVHASMTIGGRDIVKEFIASEIWPLDAGLDFGEVAEAEAPISKVIVPLPKFVAAKSSLLRRLLPERTS